MISLRILSRGVIGMAAAATALIFAAPGFGARVAFGPPASTALTPYPTGLVADDFDRDGDSDIALANSGSNTVSIFLSNGDGTFSAPTSYPGPAYTYALSTGDFDRDGTIDLVASGLNDQAVSVFLGSGDGTFTRRPNASAEHPWSIAVADFNGDGKLDVLTASLFGKIQFLAGRDDGTFDAALEKPIGVDQMTSVAAGDVDGDGTPDAVFGWGEFDSGEAWGWATLHGNGDGTFADPVMRSATPPGRPIAVEIDDFNHDARTDVVIGNYLSGTVAVALGQADGTLGPATEYTTASTGTTNLAVADFDGDGNSDVVTVDQSSSILSILFGGGDGAFGDLMFISLTEGPFDVAVGDFDHYLGLDIAVSSQFPGSLMTLLQAAVDVEPPHIVVPEWLTIDATSPEGAFVTYEATATDNVAIATFSCFPASGSELPIGDTLVECTATDTAGNMAVASFAVHVRDAAEQIVALTEKTLAFVELPPLQAVLRRRLEAAARTLVVNNLPAACRALNLYIAAVTAAPGWTLTQAEKAELIDDATRIKAVIGCT